MSEIYAMACLVHNLATVLDDGLTLAPKALRSHAESGDLLDWLQESFPHHFAMDGLTAREQTAITLAMKETAQYDTGGAYGPKYNGFAVMTAWLAYVMGKMAENRW